MKIPNPGSQKAIDKGCTCPVMDNHYGKGMGKHDGNITFSYKVGCPIHMEKAYPYIPISDPYEDELGEEECMCEGCMNPDCCCNDNYYGRMAR